MFSHDYFEARARFRRLAGKGTVELPLAVRSAREEILSIDIAWLGARAARRVVLVSSGLHGIEGFAGSAVQCALLSKPLALPADCALVLVHALNPWGFAQLRRVNEHNVDLNRNFLRDGERFSGAPALYLSLDTLLNPRSAPRNDAFALLAAWQALRHGATACRQAIAQGQYEFPQGLFYGGAALEEGPRLFLSWLSEAMQHATRVLVLDLHTGLGCFGAQTLFAEPDITADRVRQLTHWLGAPILGGAGSCDPAGFATRGSLGGKVRELLAPATPEFLTLEFGTYSGVRLLGSLRAENRWHYYGNGSMTHSSKQRLAQAFAPASAHWRDSVMAAGTSVVRAAVAAMARDTLYGHPSLQPTPDERA